jgi:hypothetical protein
MTAIFAGLTPRELLTYFFLESNHSLAASHSRDYGDKAVEILAQLSYKGAVVAEIRYRTGFHVEISVLADFQAEHIDFDLGHVEHGRLQGTWESALDTYFNDTRFDSKDAVFAGELRRIGSAREHKSLFRQAVRSLVKDLEPYGYQIAVNYS